MKPIKLNVKLSAVAAFAALACAMPSGIGAASKDLGNGFKDHGVAVPISQHRGTVATVDGQGRNVVLLWAMDYRGVYALLMIDAESGKTETYPIPFNNTIKDSPFASVLSSANKFYTHFGSHFIEFDPAKRAFTFHSKTTPQMAMSMTEADDGTIWSATYPGSGVVSYSPKTGEFRDYGKVYDQNWYQYPRTIVTDDTGHVYFQIGETASQIISFDPATSTAKPLLEESQRKQGQAFIYRDTDGKVYGRPSVKEDTGWMELYKGERKAIDDKATSSPKKVIEGMQTLFHNKFPDGTTLKSVDLVERKVTTSKPGSADKVVSIDYDSEGAIVMGCATAANGTITGGTAFPMRNFVYDPKTDTMTDRAAFGQWNTVAPIEDRFYVGGYPGGYMLEWLPNKPWVHTDKAKKESNPRWVGDAVPHIHRPYVLLPLSDNDRVLMGGAPAYGYTGGGLMIWSRKDDSVKVLTHEQLVPEHSVKSMVELPDNRILVGTTIQAGTGGEVKATNAEMYILNLANDQIEWKGKPLPNAKFYTSLYRAKNGLVYGFDDFKHFFVFNPETKEVIKEGVVSAETYGRTVHEQGPRVFLDIDDEVYVLFEKCITKLNTTTHEFEIVAKSPVEMKAGAAYLDGRIYFVSESHLCSYQLK